MITIYDGDTFFALQYNGDALDSATGLDPWFLDPMEPPQNDYKYFCYFNQGQSASLMDGVTLTGQTSGAVIKVGRVITTGGVLLSSTGAGVLIFRKVSGEIASGENLRVSSTTYCVSASIALAKPLTKPKAVFLSIETNSVRYFCGGVTPTNAVGTPANLGVLLRDTQDIVLTSYLDMRTFKMINAASGSNATVNVEIKY